MVDKSLQDVTPIEAVRERFSREEVVAAITDEQLKDYCRNFLANRYASFKNDAKVKVAWEDIWQSACLQLLRSHPGRNCQIATAVVNASKWAYIKWLRQQKREYFYNQRWFQLSHRLHYECEHSRIDSYSDFLDAVLRTLEDASPTRRFVVLQYLFAGSTQAEIAGELKATRQLVSYTLKLWLRKLIRKNEYASLGIPDSILQEEWLAK